MEHSHSHCNGNNNPHKQLHNDCIYITLWNDLEKNCGLGRFPGLLPRPNLPCSRLTAHGSPMAPTTEFTGLKTELQFIERLINELLYWRSVLCSRLAMLKSPYTQRSPALVAVAAVAPDDVSGSTSTPSWDCVVKGQKKCSLPLYVPLTPVSTMSLWQNFFPAGETSI